jgi:hypothetical protein
MYARGRFDQSNEGMVSGDSERSPVRASRQRTMRICGWLFQESLDTLMLGSLSTSLGVVLILVPVLRATGSSLHIDLPLTTYLALVPIGTSLGVIGIVRARIMNRFTSPLSTLGALLSFAPAAPQILGSMGIYILIISPFALAFFGSNLVEKLCGRVVRRQDSDDEDAESGD